MKSSEKKVGKKPYGNGYPSSNPLRNAATKGITTKKYLCYERTAYNKDNNKISKYEKTLDEAKENFKAKQKDATKLREVDLNELAKKRADQWDLKVSTAITVIKNSEESKRVHKKQRAFLKPRHGGIQKILVPKPISGVLPSDKHITDINTQCYIEDSQEVFDVLLRQNFRQLTKSQTSVFTTGEIASKIGHEAEMDFAEKVLQGLEPNEISCQDGW